MTPQEKYKKSTMKQIKLELNRKTDADLIEWLEKQPNRQGLIKRLLREEKSGRRQNAEEG